MFRNIIDGKWQLLSVEFYHPDHGWVSNLRATGVTWEFDGRGGFTQYFKGRISRRDYYYFNPSTRDLYIFGHTFRVNPIHGAVHHISNHKVRIKARHLASIFIIQDKKLTINH
jgi:hypothetical protein